MKPINWQKLRKYSYTVLIALFAGAGIVEHQLLLAAAVVFAVWRYDKKA